MAYIFLHFLKYFIQNGAKKNRLVVILTGFLGKNARTLTHEKNQIEKQIK